MRISLRSPRTLALAAVVLIAAVVAAVLLSLHGGDGGGGAHAKTYTSTRIGTASVPDPLSRATKKLPHSLNADEAAGAIAPVDSVLTAFLSLTGGSTEAHNAWSFVSGLGSQNNGLAKTSYTPSAKVTAVGYSATPTPSIASGKIMQSDYPFLDTTWIVTDSVAAAKSELKRFKAAKVIGRDPMYAAIHGTVVVVSPSPAAQTLATTTKTLGTSPTWQNSHDKHAKTGALWMNPYGFGASVVALATHSPHGAEIVKALDSFLDTNLGNGRTWTASLTKVTATTAQWKGTWTGGTLPTKTQIVTSQIAVSTDPAAAHNNGASSGAPACHTDPCVTITDGGQYATTLFQTSANLNSGIGGHVDASEGVKVGPKSQWIALLAGDLLAGVANGQAAQSLSPTALHAALNPDHTLTLLLTNG